MRLTTGTRLGAYEVVALVGAGGMGEVYKARDTRLGRLVAVKVLPAEVALDSERRKRFELEARAVAALSHPNICTVFDVGREDRPSGPVDYLVMELLEGDTLAQRLRRGPMPTDQILKAGLETASALEQAHRTGVVHRDVKPGNILLTKAGAKLLDFGLARLRPRESPSDARSTAVTEHDPRGDALTDAGHAVGTYPYMAPEQLEGKAVDGRADLFALGAVLYEMATGQRAFAGASRASVAAAILTRDPPPITSLRPVAPLALERLVKALLAKDPDERVQSAHDIVLRLREIVEDSGRGRSFAGAATRRPRRRSIALLSVLALVLVAAVALWRWARPPVLLGPPRVVPLTTLRGSESTPTFSPDGEQVAFAWGGESDENVDIYLMIIGSSEVRRLTTDAAVENSPSWSPDGRQIAFLRTLGGERYIHVVSPLGGNARKVSDFPAAGRLTWSHDGSALAAVRAGLESDETPGAGGIHLVPLDGAPPRLLVRAPPGGTDRAPIFSADERRLAYAVCVNGQVCDVQIADLDPGHVPIGAARLITHQHRLMDDLAWTPDGDSIVYGALQAGFVIYAWRVGADGSRPPERIDVLGSFVRSLAIAPARDRIAFSRSRLDIDFYRFVPGGAAVPLKGASTAFEILGGFSPDGRRIAFESTRSGEHQEIWLSDADGSNAEQLTRGPGRWQGSPSWSPDGRRIAFDSQAEDGRWDVWTIDVGGGAPRRLTRDPGDENLPSWSRDGRSIYFHSSRTGGAGIWRIPAEGGEDEPVLTIGQGLGVGAQHESLDGNTLFFVRSQRLTGRSLATGEERTVAECVAASYGTFDVAADGIYYPACAPGPDKPLHRVDPTTGRDEMLGMLERFRNRIAVSPDGRTILYSKIVSEGDDLMLVENFR